MALRGHEPVVIEDFNGLWVRGDQDSVPLDHFSDGNNIAFIESGFETRPGLDTLIAKGNIVRMYNYKMQNGESFLALDSSGRIWHSLLDGSGTIYGPILTIADMEDFGFVSIAGRAYITPFKTFTDLNGTEYQKGLENEFVYVYKGDGSAARKAAGDPPTNSDDTPMIAFNNPLVGLIEEGIRILAVTFSDGADDSTSLGPTVLPTVYAPGDQSIQLTNIPIGGVGITQRKIWSTKVIPSEEWTANYADFTFYLVSTVNDNTTTSVILSFAEADLVTAFAPGSLPNPTTGGLEVRNSTAEGYCSLGLHIVGVVYETDTGYLSAPGPETFGVQTFIDERKAITISNIPTSPDSFVVKRHLVASKAITGYNGNDHDYQLFFIPSGTIEDNTTTSITLSFFDGELLDDASHLMDNFSEIPAGVTLTTYHGRMALSTTFEDIGVFYFSAPGEPEAIDQVDGIVIFPLDGLPITNGQEYRDIFYAFKKVRTYATIDNGDVPSTWQVTTIDNGIGASIHGIAQVLDSGGINIEFLMIVDFSGIMIFNGLFQRPELSWKILDLWTSMSRNFFSAIQIINDSLTQIVYMTLPNGRLLIGDYKNGLNPKEIRWMTWSFDIEANTIALFNTNTLAIGSEGNPPSGPPDSGGGSGGGTGGGGEPIPDPPPPSTGDILNVTDFEYMGCFRMPDSIFDSQFAYGGLAARKVAGQLRFFVYGRNSGALRSVIASGTSTTQFTIATGEGVNYTIGNKINVVRAANGTNLPENREIQNIVGDVITVASALGGIPAINDYIYTEQEYQVGELIDPGTYNTDYTQAPRATIHKIWNDIFNGRRVSWQSGALVAPLQYQVPTGLYWHEGNQLLYWGYLNTYNVTDNPDWGLGATSLDGPDGNDTTSYGPWRITAVDGNGTTWYGPNKGAFFFQMPGGQMGLIGNGNIRIVNGPSLYSGLAFPGTSTPGGFGNPDLSAPDRYLDYYYMGDSSVRPYYFNRDGSVVGEIRSFRYPTNPNRSYLFEWEEEGSPTIWANPALTGKCSWQVLNGSNGAIWLQGSNKRGIIFFSGIVGSAVQDPGSVLAAHSWYLNAGVGHGTCTHGFGPPDVAAITGFVTTAGFPALIIYNPDDLMEVKAGTKVDYTVDPSNWIDLANTFNIRSQPPSGVGGPFQVRGAYFDEDRNYLFMLAPNADNSIAGLELPLVHVFKVNNL